MNPRYIFSLFVAVAIFAQPHVCFAADVGNLAVAGEELGKEIAGYLKSAGLGDGHMLVAVFRFGNAANSVPQELSAPTLQLQGHLIDTLGKALGGSGSKFNVLDVETIDTYTGGSIALKYEDPAFTRLKASQKNIAVPIVGTFLLSSDKNWYEISTKVITPSTVSPVLSVRVRANSVAPSIPGAPFNPSNNANLPSGRFSVEIFAKAKDEANFSKLDLQQAADQSDQFRNVLFLKLDRARYFGRPYEIRLKNFESKPFVLPEPLSKPGPSDKDRVFGAAVYIDGVASIMRKVGSDLKLDIRHPAYVGKHILTASNRVFVESATDSDDGRFIKSKLIDYNAPGHSEWQIRGFQKGNDTAASFVFGNAAESVGTGLGQNVNQIGLISIYFYAEELNDDTHTGTWGGLYAPAAPGTTLGPDVPSPIIEVGVKNYYRIPAEVWHIRYAYSDQPLPTLKPPIQVGGN
jgi:hypothetical protein